MFVCICICIYIYSKGTTLYMIANSDRRRWWCSWFSLHRLGILGCCYGARWISYLEASGGERETAILDANFMTVWFIVPYSHYNPYMPDVLWIVWILDAVVIVDVFWQCVGVSEAFKWPEAMCKDFNFPQALLYASWGKMRHSLGATTPLRSKRFRRDGPNRHSMSFTLHSTVDSDCMQI